MKHECKNSDFRIVQTNNWIKPKAEDNAWGFQCHVCKSIIAMNYKKSELK